MGDNSELILGSGGTAIALLSWALNRLVSKIDAEIEKLWAGHEETKQQLQELAILVAKLEASQSRHK